MEFKIIRGKSPEEIAKELNHLNESGQCPCIYGDIREDRTEENDERFFFALVSYIPHG